MYLLTFLPGVQIVLPPLFHLLEQPLKRQLRNKRIIFSFNMISCAHTNTLISNHIDSWFMYVFNKHDVLIIHNALSCAFVIFCMIINWVDFSHLLKDRHSPIEFHQPKIILNGVSNSMLYWVWFTEYMQNARSFWKSKWKKARWRIRWRTLR